MTKDELMEKLAKAKVNVAKAESTYEKHKNAFLKKMDEVMACRCHNRHEWDKADYEWQCTDEGNTNYWLICAAERKCSDMVNAEKKIAEKKKIVEKYEEAIKKAENEEKELYHLPIVLQALIDVLAERWVEYDLRIKEEIRSGERKASYAEQERYYYKTKEDFVKQEMLNARMYVLDLIRRTKKKIGEITDWNDVRLDNNGYALNGKVIGTKGVARLETIVAGGYNIQRLHLRTLVK